MGNTLSDEQVEERLKYLNKIFDLEFPNLDLGNRQGFTSYIDFIKPEELGTNNVMIGKDESLRPFVVFKAEFEYPNGFKKKTFTTFFKRYYDNDILYHCCGHYGTLLMDTQGGSSNEQIKMLYELLVSGEYKLDKNKINEFGLNYQMGYLNSFEDEIDENILPIGIKLGYSD